MHQIDAFFIYFCYNKIVTGGIMQRYFAKEKNNDTFILYDTDLHHIKNVMRYKEEDKIEVVYDDKIHICQIKNLLPLTLEVIETYQENNELNIELNVAISLVSEQKFDLIIQKLTELGASNIIPIKSERSIVKIDDKKASKKIARWQMICKEASEQSHRTKIPNVNNIISLKELIDYKADKKLVCSLNEKTKSLDKYLTEDTKNILLVIGPEGGLSTREEELLLTNNFLPVSLGKRVLRVETAAIYIASIINYIYGG